MKRKNHGWWRNGAGLVMAVVCTLAAPGPWAAPVAPATIVNQGGANPMPVDDSKNTRVSVAEVKERWGIEPLGIQVSAAGYLLDFRYRVVDLEKASRLLDPKMTPYVRVPERDARLGVPVTDKLGALRSSTRQLKADRTYFMLFTNPVHFVKPGDAVQVVIGSVTIDGLRVH